MIDTRLSRKLGFILVYGTAIMVTSCARYIVKEFDEFDQQVSSNYIGSYGKNQSLRQQMEALVGENFYKCLWHCRLYLRVIPDRNPCLVVKRALFSSLLRYDNPEPTLKSTYENNIFIIESVELLDEYSDFIPEEIKSVLGSILNQGYRNQEAFQLFTVCLRRKIRDDLMQSGLNARSGQHFLQLAELYPRWCQTYNARVIDDWNFMALLEIR